MNTINAILDIITLFVGSIYTNPLIYLFLVGFIVFSLTCIVVFMVKAR